MACDNASFRLLTVTRRGSCGPTRKLMSLRAQSCVPNRRYRYAEVSSGFESLDLFFFSVFKQDPCFTAVEEHGFDKRLVELELACKADGAALADAVSSGHCCHC